MPEQLEDEATLGVISDILRVRTNPEVKTAASASTVQKMAKSELSKFSIKVLMSMQKKLKVMGS